MKGFFLFSMFFWIHFSNAQVANNYAIQDAKMASIPDSETTTTAKIAAYINSNFNSESDKIRAVFYWTATSISYDVANMDEPNFVYTPQEKITNALKTRKGVCIHYAEVFNEIANSIGIKTHIIVGYTKQNGKLANVGHAWCGSKVDGKWMLFDPTWAAGYINGANFVKKLNNFYFKTPSNKMILSHMPFDYMWQFLENPINNDEFISGVLHVDKPKFSYDFSSAIEKNEKLSDEEQLFESIERVEKNGVVLNLISEYLSNKKNNFSVLRQNNNLEKLNQIVESYNEGLSLLNDFIYARNRKFKTIVNDEQLQQMTQIPKDKLQKCQSDVYKIGSVGKENIENLNSLKKAINESVKQAEEQDNFVKKYLSKDKSGRKAML